MAAEQQGFAAGPIPPEQAGQQQAEPPVAKPGDLSAEIAATVDKEPGDRVRVTWIAGSNYRCNWWAPGCTDAYDNPAMVGLTVTTHRVRRSRFLSVTKTGGRLVIREHSRSGPAGR